MRFNDWPENNTSNTKQSDIHHLVYVQTLRNLTHCGRNKMAKILQKTFPNPFSQTKSLYFDPNYNISCILKFPRWFHGTLGMEKKSNFI